jgi:RNA polymerase sigma-70 factor (ECF subfamily)
MEEARTRTQLVRTARRILSDDECEDAAHDAVVQALVSASRFREDAQVGTWLYRIAFNAALMKQRSARRASQRLLRVQREGHLLPVATSGASPPASWLIEEGEQRAHLRAAVAQLPEVYRTVIERCVYEEQEPESVARALGITPSALRTRFARARDRLRQLLEAERAAAAHEGALLAA